MRDGVELATDLYRPKLPPHRLSSILIRTQYGKGPYRIPEPQNKLAVSLASQGFAVLVQDLRGLYDSGGSYALALHDAEDGYDSMTWIASQEWSTQRVGTIGCSSLGITQVLLAQLKHPAHRCAIAQGSGGATGSAGQRYRMWDVRRGGAVEMGWSVPWFYENGAHDGSRPEPKSTTEYERAMKTLPLIDVLNELGSPATDWEGWISHNPGDPWWTKFGLLTEESTVDVPTLFVNSWHDVGAADALHQQRVFSSRAVSSTAREHQYVILSPSLHCGTEALESTTVVGERNFGDARLGCAEIYANWLDCWLNEKPEKISGLPKVTYFTMGRNEWRSGSQWPPPQTRDECWFLRSDGTARTSNGSGELSLIAPTREEPEDVFECDPGNPVPSVGWGSGQYSGPKDYQHVELRHDVLCYTSEPLESGLELTGFVKAVLFVSSTARDTDFVVRLLDVDPEGRALDIVDGILRARYRDGFHSPVHMQRGEVYRIEIDLDATSAWFAPGHRIRLEVAGSAFPRYDRNLNTGGNNWDESEWVIAENAVHHSANLASHVVLPAVRNHPVRPGEYYTRIRKDFGERMT